MEIWPFFRAAMAGLGKYHTGGYGRIGVYRVKIVTVYFAKCSKYGKYCQIKQKYNISGCNCDIDCQF